ncbi:hypothetical protein [Nocardioides mesophilus]|uniref:Uncharacterized protein n=1 Tax=Nocardioides mesophilus TaxID=433659 RepID=A0A7G9R9B2_9ACTN|nr:hypothetical protein [Nocardioides mesophilus]QNN52187.1 hypothetical protein H9L09_17065 [Nocardioides mesophilus]
MDPWPTEKLADALRDVLARVSVATDCYQPLDVAVKGRTIRLGLKICNDPTTYVVMFSPEAPYLGASTGEQCRSPDEWAKEVWLMLDEEIGTRSVDNARRSALPDGFVQLHL